MRVGALPAAGDEFEPELAAQVGRAGPGPGPRRRRPDPELHSGDRGDEDDDHDDARQRQDPDRVGESVGTAAAVDPGQGARERRR